MSPVRTFQGLARGQVQGVGFRWAVLARARQLHLTGGVRNLADGSVEVTAQGPQEDLNSLIAEIREGIQVGNVSALDVAWIEGARSYPDFQIWPTR